MIIIIIVFIIAPSNWKICVFCGNLYLYVYPIICKMPTQLNYLKRGFVYYNDFRNNACKILPNSHFEQKSLTNHIIKYWKLCSTVVKFFNSDTRGPWFILEPDSDVWGKSGRWQRPCSQLPSGNPWKFLSSTLGILGE